MSPRARARVLCRRVRRPLGHLSRRKKGSSFSSGDSRGYVDVLVVVVAVVVGVWSEGPCNDVLCYAML